MSVTRTKGKRGYRKTQRRGAQRGGGYENVLINTNQIGDYTISTLIGTYSGTVDNSTAKITTTPTNALKDILLQDPRNLVLDTAGNLYITSHNCIVKVVPPAATTYAMRGTVAIAIMPPPHSKDSIAFIYAGYDSTGKPAPGASLSTQSGNNIRYYNLWGIAYDPAQNCLYVSDCQVHQIAKVYTDSGGTICSDLYVDTNIGLNTPKGIAVGPDGALYIADNGKNRVCKMTTGKTFSVISGTITDPQGVGVDALGNVYVSSANFNGTADGHCIYILVPDAAGTSYTQSVFAGSKGNASHADGSLTEARFNTPQAIFYEPVHNYLYVYDGRNRRIRLININTKTVATILAGESYQDGSVNGGAQFRGSWTDKNSALETGNQTSYSGITVDPNGVYYITDWANNNLVRQATPIPASVVASITKAEYDAYWNAQRASSAVAQNASSAVAQQISGSKASSAVAQVASSARASSAVAQRASSALAQGASSSVAQVASSAVASSALAQVASSAVAQGVSSALAESVSSARESSATAQVASSAVAQGVSSAVAESVSSARESSATAQVASSAVAQTVSSALAQSISGARESSATAQVASSALAETISGAQASSATAERASSSLAQSISGAQASSATAQRASSSLAQKISGARASSADAQDASSAVAQRVSSAVAQRVSSAVAQTASSATQQEALVIPVANKDAIVANIQAAQQYIDSQIVIVYSSSSSPSDVEAAKQAIADSMGELQNQWQLLSEASAEIFAIAPLYQDRVLQTVVRDPYLTSMGYIKLYDTMRNGYVVIDSQGYLVQNMDLPGNRRHPLQGGGGASAASGASGLYTTDILLTGDLSLPQNSSWKSYFDTVARRYFYINSSTGVSQYEHPSPPAFSGSHAVVTDITVGFLPPGWVKLQSVTPALPYYFNINTMQALWTHPNPPPNPSTLSQVQDTTLFPSYKKYIDPTTTKPFYVNASTLEGQWNFPPSAFNVGPSSAASMAVASSAVAQTVSSALAQSISGARESSATAQVASSAVAQTVSSARQQFASSAEQQTASSAMYQTIIAATVTYQYILLTVNAPRNPPNDTAINGFFVNLTRVPNTWNAGATATAVDPITFAPINDAAGNPITYNAGSTYGNLFDTTLTSKVFPVQPSGKYPVSILINNTVPISFNAYYFGTADLNTRDMLQWSIKGSKDGITFVMIDDRSSSPQTSLVPDERNKFIPPIELGVGQNLAASSAFKQMASSATVSSATAQRASSSLMQSISGAQASSAVAQVASSALAQKISGAEESSARAQDASSALAQAISGARESSATAQVASSALAQSISGAQESSATAQRASSSLMQSISGAQASSATAQRASSSLMQSISGAQESSARAQDASSALAQKISGAEESSARAQDASSALAQAISGARASSATAQTVSSALAQSISGAQESSARAQEASMAEANKQASSALAQAISGARASSATAQEASSALAQAISGAQASSATAQGASSALAQSISGAQASSAVAQVASSALAQAISGARASSATAQEASSALAQAISGAQASSALAQSISGAQASSATAQDASSALAQSISGSRESSATAQVASSAVAQVASSAVAQVASSARQQSASSAQLESDFSMYIAEKDTIKSDLQAAQSYITGQLSNIYRRNTSVTLAALEDLKTSIGDFIATKAQLAATGQKILRLHSYYQDVGLQTAVPSPTLTRQGLKKVYDTLRNSYLVLDSRGNIVPNPESPKVRKAASGARQYGGAPKLSRKVSRVH